jgi:head-tail adaptor
MRHRVNIQQRTTQQDPVTGDLDTTWVNVYENVPCAIESLSVKEFIQSQATQSEMSVRIVMRMIRGFTYSADLRLVGTCGCHNGKIYDPAGWLEDKTTAQEYVTAPCSQKASEA